MIEAPHNSEVGVEPMKTSLSISSLRALLHDVVEGQPLQASSLSARQIQYPPASTN
jgi:hypothetical protein